MNNSIRKNREQSTGAITAIVRHAASYITPQTVYMTRSRINGAISVEEYRGNRRIVVSQYWQSGRDVEQLFAWEFENYPADPTDVRNILMLGVCGGSAGIVCNRLFPGAHITGVDIDPAMVAVGRKYGQLDRVERMSVIVGDARTYLRTHDTHTTFQLIVNDMYVGCRMPRWISGDAYMKHIGNTLAPGGVFFTNATFVPEFQPATERLIHATQRHFSYVDVRSRGVNAVIIARFPH